MLSYKISFVIKEHLIILVIRLLDRTASNVVIVDSVRTAVS